MKALLDKWESNRTIIVVKEDSYIGSYVIAMNYRGQMTFPVKIPNYNLESLHSVKSNGINKRD